MKNKILRRAKNSIGIFVKNTVRAHGGDIYFGLPHNSENKRIFELISEFDKRSILALKGFKYQNLYSLIKKVEKNQGDVAEVGVWKGSSAKLLCDTTKKQVHLFDTFEGLPKPTDKDDSSQFKEGTYHSLFDEVKEYLKEYPNAHLYKGLFPETAGPIKDKKFSFVHLDVDLYESTLKCLEFFYPRMINGGVIISHDYTCAVGVKKAFDEFFKDKPEIILAPSAGVSQCMVIKV